VSEEIEGIMDNWLTTDEAVDATGYGAEYLRQLARADKITSRKLLGRWLFEREGLLAYKRKMDALGRKKHDPRGVEHALEGAQ
jgi:hypothetical protein